MADIKPALIQAPDRDEADGVAQREIARLKNLWEDALLLRFYLSRRTNVTKLLSQEKRNHSDEACTKTIELLERMENNETIPVSELSQAVQRQMHVLDILIDVARSVGDRDAAGETVFLVTPESLRASLSLEEKCLALGVELPRDAKKTDSFAKKFIMRVVALTVFMFLAALAFHLLALESFMAMHFDKDFLIPASAFLWSFVGALIWILVRFRKFGAAYAFDPAYAEIFSARVVSGSIITSISMYFVFGGKNPWAQEWVSNLPLWAFIMGYAGKLQIDFLRILVKQIESSIMHFFSEKSGSGKRTGDSGEPNAQRKPKPDQDA